MKAFASVVAPLALAAASTGQELKVGQKAPPLSVTKWVKGDPVESFAADKAYVVEFWATWCGPCIASMPHLSALQKQYGDKGLTIIGVTSKDPRNSLAKVEEMVKAKGDTMGYTVAWDESRATSRAYMEAAGRQGIPCSFVVDKQGTIAYIGHPMWLDLPVAGVIAGTWDAEAGSKRLRELEGKLSDLGELAQEDPKKALAEMQDLLEQVPSLGEMLGGMHFTLLMEAGDVEGANKVAADLVDRAIKANDANALNEVAWGIVDPEQKWKERNVDLALRAAAKAVAITEEKDANILDTLARAYFWKKDLKKALELQTKAVDLAPGRPELAAALEEYKRALGAGKDEAAGAGPGKGK
jgi:thiol-disulfide isomerase/thioredoxin